MGQMRLETGKTDRRSPRRRARGLLAAALVWAAANLGLAADGVGVSIQRIDGTRVAAEWVGADAAAVQVVGPDGRTAIAVDELEEVWFRDAADRVPGDATVFLLSGSGRLFGRLLRSDGDAVVAETTLGGEMMLPFSHLAGIRLADPQQFPKAAEVFDYSLSSPLPGKDILVTRDTEDVKVVQGRLEALGPEEGSFYFGDRARPFQTEKMFGIVFAAGPAGRRSEPLTVDLVDGSRISGRLARSDGQLLAVEASFGSTIRVPLSDVAGLRFRSDRVVQLSDLSPVREVSEGRLHPPWPVRLDRNAANGPIVLDGRTFERGLGMHSRTELTYEIDGDYETFVATIGIDDAVRPRGVVTFRVMGDGEVLFDSGPVTGRDPAQSVKVNVKGVDTLTLVADYGDGVDLSDYANWGGARLLLPPKKRS